MPPCIQIQTDIHTHSHIHIQVATEVRNFQRKAKQKTDLRWQTPDTSLPGSRELGLGHNKQRRSQSQSHCHQTGNEPDEHETRKLSSSNHYSCGVQCGVRLGRAGREETGGRERKAKPRAKLQFQNLVTANVSRCRWALLSNESNDDGTIQPTDRIAVGPFDCCSGCSCAVVMLICRSLWRCRIHKNSYKGRRALYAIVTDRRKHFRILRLSDFGLALNQSMLAY